MKPAPPLRFCRCMLPSAGRHACRALPVAAHRLRPPQPAPQACQACRWLLSAVQGVRLAASPIVAGSATGRTSSSSSSSMGGNSSAAAAACRPPRATSCLSPARGAAAGPMRPVQPPHLHLMGWRARRCRCSSSWRPASIRRSASLSCSHRLLPAAGRPRWRRRRTAARCACGTPPSQWRMPPALPPRRRRSLLLQRQPLRRPKCSPARRRRPPFRTPHATLRLARPRSRRLGTACPAEQVREQGTLWLAQAACICSAALPYFVACLHTRLRSVSVPLLLQAKRAA